MKKLLLTAFIALATLLMAESHGKAEDAVPKTEPPESSIAPEGNAIESAEPKSLGELATFDDRKKTILQAFAETGTDHFLRAECLFTLGRTKEALVQVNLGLNPLVPGNKINRWMHGGNTGFQVWPGIDCYIRFEKLMDAATKERYRKIYTGGVFYARLSTSNHKIMAAMTRYLATQVWGADSFHADPYFMANDPYIIEMTSKAKNMPASYVWGTLFSKEDPTGEKYLRSTILSSAQGGPGEYASRPYGAQNVLPLLTIADCARDPVLAGQARIAYEVCLAQVAPVWLQGNLATFAPRSYPDTENQHPWGFATLPWLYFGGEAPDLSHAKAAAEAAISSFRLPGEILKAATDRTQPYFYKARIDSWALNHYVNRSYALFSRSAKLGGKPFQGQSYPCGVMWLDPDAAHGTHLWITNPDEDEPGKMGIHTHGVNSDEQEILGRDSLLFVFKLLPRRPFQYALAYVPGGYKAMINDSVSKGKIYLNYGSVLICVTGSQPFNWDPAAGIYAPASKPRTGDSEFRLKAPNCALAIETALPSDFPAANPEEQLRNFRAALLAKSSLNYVAGTNSATYTNRLGDTIACAFDGPDQVNGSAVDYANWPSSESPWTSQKSEYDPLTVTDGKNVRTYDFANWKITDSLKP